MRESPMPYSWSKPFCAILVAVASLNNNPLYSQTSPAPAAEKIRVYISVSNKKDLPVLLPESGLSASIDKQPVQVLSLQRAENEKLVFAVLVDTSGSNYDHADAIRKAALELFQGLSDSNQEGYLVTFGVSASATTKSIRAARVQQMLAALKFYGGTALYETIKATCETRLSRAANPLASRRVILLLSDGDDNYSRATLAQAEGAAQTEGVSVFSLSIPSDDSPGAGHVLKQLTQATGGRIALDKDLVRSARSLVGLVRAQWAVDLAVPPHIDPKLHTLTITSSEKDIVVFAPTQVSLP